NPVECQNNNTVVLRLFFTPAPTITVVPVFLHVTGNLNGTTFNDVVSSQAQFDSIIQVTSELYPIHVEQGARRDVTCGPGANDHHLVDRVRDAAGLGGWFWAVAGDPSVFYLGIFPGDQGNFPVNQIAAGAGRVGGIGAWVRADDPVAGAHELGHNIGFDH